MNVLVTGAGALLGQGIIRSLNEIENSNLEIHTCDPNFRSGGHFIGNHAHYIPLANNEDYLSKLQEIIERNNIQLLFIGTDTELPVISREQKEIEEKFKVKIIVSNEKVIEIANDKWKTAEFLKRNGFPYPYSVLSSDEEGVDKLKEKEDFPYFAKPTDGARSKGIVKVENKDILAEITSYPNNLVIQEFISGDEGEYTSGCLVLGKEAIAVVTLKRDLRDGNTYRAFYEKSFSKYDHFIKKVATTLGVEGPCNFQFRIRDGEPVIFEINARFSGTTPLRSFFGFNEVAAVVNFYSGNQEFKEPELLEGEVLRVWSDLFVSKSEIERFENSEEVDSPKAIYHPFKKK